MRCQSSTSLTFFVLSDVIFRQRTDILSSTWTKASNASKRFVCYMVILQAKGAFYAVLYPSAFFINFQSSDHTESFGLKLKILHNDSSLPDTMSYNKAQNVLQYEQHLASRFH